MYIKVKGLWLGFDMVGEFLFITIILCFLSKTKFVNYLYILSFIFLNYSSKYDSCMNHYRESLELKQLLEKYLFKLNDLILNYSPLGDEKKFEFLIKKA